ncbi:MAG: chemotaxis protein CheW [Nitrospirae bacterium]|nr:chemotaxis protein CheW [Nitrospirota bacterium]
MKVVTFLIGTRWCVMPVGHLVEILPARELLPLPRFPAGPSTQAAEAAERGMIVAGIVDYRGRAIPVMRLRLEPPAGDHQEAAAPGSAVKRRLLVLNGNPPGALEVGRVDAVIELDEQSIQPPGEVGLQDHGVVSGVCRLHHAYAFIIDGASISAGCGAGSRSGAPAGVAQGVSTGASPGASNG